MTVNDALPAAVARFFDRIVRPEQLLSALPEAMRVLLDPAETGAVTLSLPQDVQAEAYDFPAALFEPRTWHVAPPAAGGRRAAGGGAGAARLAPAAADRRRRGPLLRGAARSCAELSDRFGIPVAETSAGKGALPSGELALGGIGRDRHARRQRPRTRGRPDPLRRAPA